MPSTALPSLTRRYVSRTLCAWVPRQLRPSGPFVGCCACEPCDREIWAATQMGLDFCSWLPQFYPSSAVRAWSDRHFSDSCPSTPFSTTWSVRPPSPRFTPSWVLWESTFSWSSLTLLASSSSTWLVSSCLVTTRSRPCSPRVPPMTPR